MTPPVILVFDYPGRRSEARVADLRLEEAGYDVRYLMRSPLPRAVSSEDYAAEAMSRITDPDLRVHAILAYCMAAPLGQEAAVSTRCARLLLFDGEPSTPQAIGTEFRSMVESVETAAAPLPPWWKAELLDERSDTFLKLSEQYLTALVRRNVASDSLWDGDASNEDEIEEATVSLVNTFLDWTAYLVAAYRSDFPAWEGKVTNFLSRSQAIIGSWPGAALTESVRVDSDRTGLLSDESTRRLVLEALEASR